MIIRNFIQGILTITFCLGFKSANSQGFSFGDDESADPAHSSFGLRPFVEYGVFSGVQNESLAGLSSLGGGLSYQKIEGFMRPDFGVEVTSVRGTLTLSGTQTTFRLLNLGLHLGLALNLHSEGALSPFIRFKASGGRGSLNLVNPPAGLGIFERPNYYTYGIEVGIDAQKQNRSWLNFGMGYFFENHLWGPETLATQSLSFFLGF